MMPEVSYWLSCDVSVQSYADRAGNRQDWAAIPADHSQEAGDVEDAEHVLNVAENSFAYLNLVCHASSCKRSSNKRQECLLVTAAEHDSIV